MRALMSLPAIEGRAAVPRGEDYQATAQEALDDVRMRRGERVGETSAVDVPPPPKAKT